MRKRVSFKGSSCKQPVACPGKVKLEGCGRWNIVEANVGDDVFDSDGVLVGTKPTTTLCKRTEHEGRVKRGCTMLGSLTAGEKDERVTEASIGALGFSGGGKGMLIFGHSFNMAEK